MSRSVKSFQNLGSFGEVTLDITKLQAIERELGKRYVTKVGIMGAKSSGRQDIMRKSYTSENGKIKRIAFPSNQTNAEIGLVHEKGSKANGIPRRSFLEMPLEMKLPKVLAAVGQSVIDSLTKENLRGAYVQLGILAENIIQSAFKTGGFGKWAPIKDATRQRKNSSAILIDTAQLRKSISSTVQQVTA